MAVAYIDRKRENRRQKGFRSSSTNNVVNWVYVTIVEVQIRHNRALFRGCGIKAFETSEFVNWEIWIRFGRFSNWNAKLLLLIIIDRQLSRVALGKKAEGS